MTSFGQGGAVALSAILTLIIPVQARGAEPTAEIVVSMRYLQGSGTSHAQLYLYREDGKLLRPLTNDDSGQDFDPIFSPDGEQIVFTRELHGGIKQCWSIEPRGGSPHQLPEPDWYMQTKPPLSFGAICIPHEIRPGTGPSTAAACTFSLLNGKTEVIITPTPPADPDAPEHWDVSLRIDDGKPAKIGELPGYSAGFLSRQKDDPAQSFLQEGALAVVFCYTHLDSTAGDTVSALDLHAQRVVQLSSNWADPIPLPGEAAFLTLTENRYLPYGDGEHTANCSYVEHWDAALNVVRYANDKAPGVCYGASIYRPGHTPTTVTVRRNPD